MMGFSYREGGMGRLRGTERLPNRKMPRFCAVFNVPTLFVIGTLFDVGGDAGREVEQPGSYAGCDPSRY